MEKEAHGGLGSIKAWKRLVLVALCGMVIILIGIQAAACERLLIRHLFIPQCISYPSGSFHPQTPLGPNDQNMHCL